MPDRIRPLSDIVAAEIADAPEPVQRKYAELAGLGAEVLEVDESILLADTYQERNILTPKFYDDGLHIALATAAEVDVLVSWNFRTSGQNLPEATQASPLGTGDSALSWSSEPSRQAQNGGFVR